jgi:hypothetical protein
MQEGYRAAKYLEVSMPTPSIRREGNTGGCDIASTYWTCEVKDPDMHGTSTRENREALPAPDTKV